MEEINLHNPEKEKSSFNEFLNKVVAHKVTEKDFELAQKVGYILPELSGTDIGYEVDGQDWLDQQKTLEDKKSSLEKDEKWQARQKAILHSNANNYRFKNLTPEEEKAKFKAIMEKESSLPPLPPPPVDTGDIKSELEKWQRICKIEAARKKLDEYEEMMATVGQNTQEKEPVPLKQDAPAIKCLMVVYVNEKDGSADAVKALFDSISFPKNVGIVYFPISSGNSRIETFNLS